MTSRVDQLQNKTKASSDNYIKFLLMIPNCVSFVYLLFTLQCRTKLRSGSKITPRSLITGTFIFSNFVECNQYIVHIITINIPNVIYKFAFTNLHLSNQIIYFGQHGPQKNKKETETDRNTETHSESQASRQKDRQTTLSKLHLQTTS